MVQGILNALRPIAVMAVLARTPAAMRRPETPEPRIREGAVRGAAGEVDAWLFDEPAANTRIDPLAPYAQSLSLTFDRVSGAATELRQLLSEIARLAPEPAPVPANLLAAPNHAWMDRDLFDGEALVAPAPDAPVLLGDATFLFEESAPIAALPARGATEVDTARRAA